jgi:hypothetical protein
MPVYNGEHFLRAAIDSVLRQAFGGFELIIVDDGSTDGTVEIVRSYEDPRIRLIQNTHNLGIVGAMQAGLHAAEGKFVARLDGDDICLSGRLGLQVEYMNSHPEIAVLGAACDVIDGSGVVVGRYCGPTTPVLIEWEMLFRNPIAHSSVMYRRAEVISLGGYRTGFPHAEDYDMWSRIGDVGPGRLAQLETAVVQLRKHGSQISVKYHTIMAHSTDHIAKANIERTLGRRVDLAAVSCLCGHAPAEEDCAGALRAAYGILEECWGVFLKRRALYRGDVRRLLLASLPVLVSLARQDKRHRVRPLCWALSHALRFAPEVALTPSFARLVGLCIVPRSARRVSTRMWGGRR